MPQLHATVNVKAALPSGPSAVTTEFEFSRGSRLQLLGRFSLVVRGRPEALGVGCRRLLAALALRDGHAGRREIAELLWPDVTTVRAAANLRSVLWRLQKCCLGVLDSDANDLRLSDSVVVDWHQAVVMARRLINRSLDLD